ncbi:MAG TPA: oligopeptide/dipeptide ABC transporter ATP-binding protein, partial [Acidimicrobiales bacterium]|nr:oligopeptide/dipeptide ABC transporter ATP-binding protein [Acidimicrobiales bacterium]
DVRTLHRGSRHPYTRALLRAAPRLDLPPHSRLATIEGRPPDLVSLGDACAFAPRCPRSTDLCTTTTPPPLDLAPTGAVVPHLVACHHPVDANAAPAPTGAEAAR